MDPSLPSQEIGYDTTTTSEHRHSDLELHPQPLRVQIEQRADASVLEPVAPKSQPSDPFIPNNEPSDSEPNNESTTNNPNSNSQDEAEKQNHNQPLPDNPLLNSAKCTLIAQEREWWTLTAYMLRLEQLASSISEDYAKEKRILEKMEVVTPNKVLVLFQFAKADSLRRAGVALEERLKFIREEVDIQRRKRDLLRSEVDLLMQLEEEDENKEGAQNDQQDKEKDEASGDKDQDESQADSDNEGSGSDDAEGLSTDYDEWVSD